MLCSEAKPRLISNSRAEAISMAAFSGTPTSGMFGGDLVMEQEKEVKLHINLDHTKRIYHRIDYLLLDEG